MTDPYRFVCPVCKTTRVSFRSTRDLSYRCRKGHEFDELLDKKHDELVDRRYNAKP